MEGTDGFRAWLPLLYKTIAETGGEVVLTSPGPAPERVGRVNIPHMEEEGLCMDADKATTAFMLGFERILTILKAKLENLRTLWLLVLGLHKTT